MTVPLVSQVPLGYARAPANVPVASTELLGLLRSAFSRVETTFQRTSIREFEGLSPSRSPTEDEPATESMDPVVSSISSTFGLADAVNSSVSSAGAEGGRALEQR